MSFFNNYLNEIDERKKIGLKPKPIDDADLIKEIINKIRDKNENNDNRKKSLNCCI